MKTLIVALLALIPICASAYADNCCDGEITEPTALVVTDPSEEDTAKADGKTEAQIEREASLVGKWQNTTYPFDLVAVDGNPKERLAGAKLTFEFRADGTYTKTLGSTDRTVEENGHWEVAPNGRQLIMFAAGSLIPDVATVKYQEYNEMVVEHALKCTHMPYCTGVKDFFFSKF